MEKQEQGSANQAPEPNQQPKEGSPHKNHRSPAESQPERPKSIKKSSSPTRKKRPIIDVEDGDHGSPRVPSPASSLHIDSSRLRQVAKIGKEAEEDENLVTDTSARDLDLTEGKERYDEFIEASDVLIQFYKEQKAFGLEKYFIQIEDWLNRPIEKEEDNLPLVIEADEGTGKKTLLVQWIMHHQSVIKQEYDDIIITHFGSAGGNNSNSFYAIYRILIKLREFFNIKQKVELLEEKIRKNFSYWLYLCDTKARKSVVYDGKVILIIEGLESFRDHENIQSNIKFWLPKHFPLSIRVITSAAKSSKSYRHLKNIGCQVIKLKAEQSVLENKIENLSQRQFFCSDGHMHRIFDIIKKKVKDRAVASSFYIKTIISCLCPYTSGDLVQEEDHRGEVISDILAGIDFELLENLNQTEDLINYILDYFEGRLFHAPHSKKKFRMFMSCLSITFKGLKLQEVMKICEISESEWKLVLVFFKSFLFTFRGFWKFANDIFNRVIREKYHSDPLYLKDVHLKIANVMRKSGQETTRILEEITNHYFLAQDYASLKQTIATIDNFLLLFNPHTKYDLCRYWQVLEEKNYDPVVEYSNGLELFDMHYSPKPEELFTIILQISRFLKEFSDFETSNTPKFRHPFIKGKIAEKRRIEDNVMVGIEDDDLTDRKEGGDDKKSGENDMGVAEEEKNGILEFLKTYSKEAKNFVQKQPGREDSSSIAPKNLPFQENYDYLYQKIEKKKKKDDTDVNFNKLNYLDDIGLEQEVQNMHMTKNLTKNILSPHEKHNFDVLSGRQAFLRHFENLIDKRNAKNSLYKKEKEVTVMWPMLSEDSLSRSGDEGDVMEMSKRDMGNNIVEPIQKVIDDIELKIKDHPEPSYYYYKRWLWMIFPWACLQTDQKFNFSHLINQCYSSNMGYLSFDEDKLLTSHAIKIVREAKANWRALISTKSKNPLNGGTTRNPSGKPVSIKAGGSISAISMKTTHNKRFFGTTTGLMKSTFSKQQKIKTRKKSRLNSKTRPALPSSGNRASKMSRTSYQNRSKASGSKIQLPSIRKQPYAGKQDPKRSTSYHSKKRSRPFAKSRGDGNKFKGGQTFTTMEAFSARNTSKVGLNTQTKIGSEVHPGLGVSESIALTTDFEQMGSEQQNLRESKMLEKFNFFSNLKKDRSKIIQFMNQSRLLEENEDNRVSKILQKSKFWEERLKSYLISAPMKQRLMMAKNHKSLRNLKTQLQEHTKKEMKILHRKNRDLIAELNKVSDRIRQQKLEISRLQNTIDNMREPNTHDQTAFQHKRDRMVRITELCEINQIQNERFIRSLNFYQNNLNKAIEDQKAEINSTEIKERKIEAKIHALVEDYNTRIREHSSLLKEIEGELERKKYIDEHISSTDMLIQKSVILKKKDINNRMINQLDKEKMESELRATEKITRKMNDELDDVKEQYQRVRILFEPGEEGEPWTEKAKMKEVVLQLERKKDLERYSIEKKMELRNIKKSNSKLKENLVTLQEANKGENFNLMDSTFIERKNQLILEKMKKEKIAQQKAKKFLNASIDIDNKTHLSVISLCKILGMTGLDHDLNILRNRAKIEEMVQKLKEAVEEMKQCMSEEDLKEWRKGNRLGVLLMLKNKKLEVAPRTEGGEDDPEMKSLIGAGLETPRMAGRKVSVVPGKVLQK